MKKFKDFIKNVKINSGVAPEPVHFRLGHPSNSGISPDPVDFRMRSRPSLKESESWYSDLMKSHNANKKTSKPSKISNKKTSKRDADDWIKDNENKHFESQDPKHQANKDTWHQASELSKELAKKAKPLSKKERETVAHYCDTSEGINDSLLRAYKNKEEMEPYFKERVEHLDKVTRNPIGHDLHVYSGIGFDPREHVNSSGHLHLPSYTSTSHSKETAHWFAHSDVERDREEKPTKHILHIHLNPSDHAAHVSQHSGSPNEHETILPRNTTLKVHPKPTVLSDGTHVWHAQVHHQD